MIEWTICENCSKLMDNSKTVCPFCEGNVRKIDMQFLKDYFYKFSVYVKTADAVNLIDELNSKNITLNSVVIDDMLNWLCYLARDDGSVTENELDFINTLLDTSYTRDEILELADSPDPFPQSFRYFTRLDESKWIDIDSQALLDLFTLFGKLFITVDGDLNTESFKRYDDYIGTLKAKAAGSFSDAPPVYDRDIDESQIETKGLDDYLEELNRLIGLEKVKKDVNSLINLVQIRKIREERGIKQPPMSLHLVFSGNPGTGKTTVARILSKIYHEIGLLSKGHLIECDRSALVGGYVGQTAIKTREVIGNAMGGILFIDEAYSLAKSSENDYGSEAIDTILKAMEDNRDDLIVIVAGYPELMDRFLHSNPGLESRFNKFIYFEDYSEEELYEIFELMCSDANLSLDEGAADYLRKYFERLCKNRPANFANGRAVRNLFEEVLTAQANRLAPQSEITDEELNTLTYEDFLTEE